MQTAEVVGFSEQLNLLKNLVLKIFKIMRMKLWNMVLEKLKKNNSVKINWRSKRKQRFNNCFYYERNTHPHDIATILDEDGVAIRAGHHCCQILHDKVGLTATARASLGVYNSKEDIDLLCNAVR